MKRYHFTVAMMFAISTVISIQPFARSQNTFRNPTQPHLSEIGNTAPLQTRTGSALHFKNPTQPHLSEIGRMELAAPETVQSQASQSQTTQLRLANGQTFFSHPPRLVQLIASQHQANAPSTYAVTLQVPVDAGQPLRAVRIAQEPNLSTIKFALDRSKASTGERFAAGSEIPLASAGGQSTPGEAMVVFAQPVQPGSSVTIMFETNANPEAGGIYEFGITAFPDGEDGLGQFLGLRRISFQDSSS
jgi:hypothetical protein